MSIVDFLSSAPIPGPFPAFPKGRRPPKQPATVIRTPPRASSGLQKLGVGGMYASLALYAYSARDFVLGSNILQDPFGTLEKAEAERKRRDREVRDRLRARRLKLAKEAEARKIEQAGMLAVDQVIFERGGAPAAPADRFIMGTLAYAKETERQAEMARARASASAGASGGPTFEMIRADELAKAQARQQAAAAAAPAAAKKPSLIKRIVDSPYFWPAAGLATAFLPKGGGGYKAPKPAPEDFYQPLTGYDPGSAISGELGGELAYAPEPETGTRADECERVDPKRTAGQCRQGWFSETPKGLYLKEWSRRPCR